MTTLELQEEFQRRIEEHRKLLYKVCNAYCSDRASREDLAQEILFQLWRSYKRFDGRCQFSTWMYRIALNVAISFYRREGHRTREALPEEQPLPEPADPEEIRLLYEFIAELDPFSKALILLYLEGNTYKEIADITGITETNVATKISRLKNKGRERWTSMR